MTEGKYPQSGEAWKKIIHYDYEGDYLCNRKVNSFSCKRTKIEENVTCKCCLLRLRKNKEKNRSAEDLLKDIKEKDKRDSNGKNFRKNYSPISQEDLNFLRKKIK